MISFHSVSICKPDDLFRILYKSYEKILKENVKNKQKYIDSWKRFDSNAFENQNIGKCVFITCLNKKPIGLVSYDPRHFPDYGVIGQNCILPEYRRQGYGTKQIEKMLEIFITNNCKKAIVSTGSIDYFMPAQNMYAGLGFKEIGRKYDNRWKHEIIEYEKELTKVRKIRIA